MLKTPQPLSDQERRVIETFQRHVTSFFSGDLDAVLDDFDESAIVFTPDGVFSGRDQIHKVYGGLLQEFGVINQGDSPGIVVDTMLLRDDSLFITWHAESKNFVFPFGTDTFVCKGGKFARQSISFSQPTPK